MKEENFSSLHCLRGHLSLLGIFHLNLPMSISFLFFFLSHAFHSSLNTEKKLAIPMLNPKFIVLWEVYKLEFGGGMGREAGGGSEGRGYMYTYG